MLAADWRDKHSQHILDKKKKKIKKNIFFRQGNLENIKLQGLSTKLLLQVERISCLV
jgi:hypothetical protein